MVSGKEAVMTESKKTRRKRADALRRRIRELQAETASPADDTPEIKPDESPHEYVERRMRELDRSNDPTREETPPED